MKKCLLLGVAAAISPCIFAAAKADDPQILRMANPISPEGEFLSDPAPRVGPDGVLRLFGSRDEGNGSKYCSQFNDIYETRDFSAWTVRKGVLASCGESDGVPGTDAPLYAPDGIFINGVWALFYCTPDRQCTEGVAVADKPEGPYRLLYSYPWAKQIDPSVFMDDDGRVYYTFGQFDMKIAELKPDLSGMVPGTLRGNVINERQHGFHEGSQLVKRGGTYYLVYTDISRRGRPTAIGYSTAKSPYGPYTRRGVIIDNFGCDPRSWNNHGGIVEFGGKWFVFYHRSTNGTKSLRKPCVEPIEFDANGLIAEVEQTSNGAGPLLDPFADTPARLACLMSGNARIVTEKDGLEHLAGIRAGDTATWRYFNFRTSAAHLRLRVASLHGGRVELRDGEGSVYGSVKIPAGDGKTESVVEMPLTRPFPSGRRAVKLVFADADRKGGDLFSLKAFRFK